MNLVRARSWGQVKPPPGARIDWGHPLAQGLVFASVVNPQGGMPVDLVTGAQGAAANGVTAWGQKAYTEVQFTKASSQSVKWPASGPYMAVPSVGLSAMVVGFHTAPTTSSLDTFLSNQSGNKGFGLFCHGGPIFGYTNNIGSGTLTSAGPDLTAGREYVILGTYSRPASLLTCYLDGVVRSSGACSLTLVAPGQGPEMGHSGGGDLGNSYTNGGVGLGYIWHRALSADEAQWLRAEPYAFIAPPAPKVFYMGFNGAGTPVTQPGQFFAVL